MNSLSWENFLFWVFSDAQFSSRRLVVCLSVGPSVRWSFGPLVRHLCEKVTVVTSVTVGTVVTVVTEVTVVRVVMVVTVVTVVTIVTIVTQKKFHQKKNFQQENVCLKKIISPRLFFTKKLKLKWWWNSKL